MSQASNRSAKPYAAMKGKGRAAAVKGKGRAAAPKGKGRAVAVNGRGRAKAKAGPGAPERVSLYDEVTARIVGELEAGRVPWVQPWGNAAATVGLPRNALTKRPYSGINVLILWGAVIGGCYPSQDWLTFNQARDAGGTVRKGERGVTVVYADRFTPEAGKRDTATLRGSDARASERASQGEEEPRSIAFLKRFIVFNVAQCDGLNVDLSDPVPLPERELLAVGEDLIRASGVEYRIGGNKAFYSPIFDFVQVPPQPAFFAQIDYYCTALHELTHATGHAKRLGRDLSHGFGSKGYAREELVAEMGSAFLCAALCIVPTLRHADYCASWLAVLKQDSRAIVRAASAASKAADWLLARLADAHAGAAS